MNPEKPLPEEIAEGWVEGLTLEHLKKYAKKRSFGVNDIVVTMESPNPSRQIAGRTKISNTTSAFVTSCKVPMKRIDESIPSSRANRTIAGLDGPSPTTSNLAL